jgi:hypothetical protein
MSILNTNSLAGTIDNINERLFYNETIPDKEKEDTSFWIMEQRGKKGAYTKKMFTPTEDDFQEGIRLFTGEKVTSQAAISHILGEESIRALILMDIDKPEVKNAAMEAGESLKEIFKRNEREGQNMGMFCCGKCSCAYWRNILAGGIPDYDDKLKAGLALLKSYRKDNGQWRRFPYYNTVFTLNGINLPEAKEELAYASIRMDRLLKRPVKNKYGERKKIIIKRALEKISSQP